jgi:hypothetical protein
MVAFITKNEKDYENLRISLTSVEIRTLDCPNAKEGP